MIIASWHKLDYASTNEYLHLQGKALVVVEHDFFQQKKHCFLYTYHLDDSLLPV